MNYEEFLLKKQKAHIHSGFEAKNLNSNLFEFQTFIVKRACNAGKYAIFADCGLGKTLMQLEWANQVAQHTNKPVLILAPLAVSGQTIKEGEKFGISVSKIGTGPIQITNYEQLKNIDTTDYIGVVLDESSILKNFDGKLRNLIIDSFQNTPYKLACTATPSPNDPMELGNHSEFLDVMGRNEMLSMYFVHDGGDTSKWRLKGHAQKTFYQWVGSWAIMLSKPDDIGYAMNGYELPDLNMIEREIKTPKRNNGQLFNDSIINATNFNQELRITKIPRIEEVASIVNNSNDNFIIWIRQNEEGQLLRELIPDAVEVKGSDSPEYKESKLLGFARDEFRVLITKTKIAQFGLNYQNCSNQIFASLDFSFEGLYQAIRRSYRFGQKNQVNIYVVTTDTMRNVVASISKKQSEFEKMQKAMSDAVNVTLNKTTMKGQVNYQKETGDSFDVRRGDCVQLIKDLPDNSIHFSIFSPPFAELYTYSDHLEDMGNSKDYNEFFEQFKFLIDQLGRVIMDGRLVAIHCMDLPIQKGKEGFIGVRDFSGMIIQAFSERGFIYHSRVTIWKDPVVEMQRTKALGLLHKQIRKDSSMSRVGIPDYLLVFRNKGENLIPITHQADDSTKSDYLPVDLWQKYASPVWMDINYSDTLQFRSARDERDEKHICPLQLPTIERSLHLWSNEGETVLSPFAGIGSEGWQSLKMNRKFVGFELKESYFNSMVKNLKNVEAGKMQSLLF